MSSEETLIQVRKDKHQQLNGGAYPLATAGNHCPIATLIKIMEGGSPKTTISSEDLSSDPEFLIRGRVSLLRKSGSITFVKLTDTSGSIQLIASKAALFDYANLSLLDLGDLIEVKGWLCLSKTGEKSLLIRFWRVLTKALRPPPEKFAGIADPEIKYRKRYLDLMSSEESRARFMVRSLIVRALRKTMNEDGFMEVETSTLNSVNSGATAKPFTTHHNALDTQLYLRIAPELYLKRLLVGGFDKVFEIGRCYRNEGIDTRHNPEFTMMESYQAYADFPQLLEFAQRLLQDIDIFLESKSHGLARQYYHKWKSERTFTLNEFRVVPMWAAVISAATEAGLEFRFNYGESFCHSPGEPDDIETIQITDPNNSRLQFIDVKSMFSALQECSSIGDKIAALFEHIAEPFLTEDYRTADGKYSVPVFITEYPTSVCTLARANDSNPNVADRFELFINNMELANGYQELNDPKEQARRFLNQLGNKDAADFDADYIEALEMGMPPAIGFGIGVERLVMAITNTASIKDVILFPTLRPNQ